jgi:hypothetical protein
MSIKITLTEKEILDTPNDSMLGELTRNKYWQARRGQERPQYDDEHFSMVIGDDGLVKSIISPYICSICNKDTSEVEYDYLVGYDHLGCVLEKKMGSYEYDKCVMCGKDTPYLVSTHIDMRHFYVEGCGQLCKDCYNK